MSGNPVSDEADPKLRYIDDYPDLPAAAPLGCPHIVDLSSLDEESPQEEMSIPDLVVTVLFDYRPAALDAFLDLKRPEVHLVIHPPKPTKIDFCIQRIDRIVKIGLLRQSKVGGWEMLYVYRIGVSATGRWTPLAWQGPDGYIENGSNVIAERAPGFAFAVAFEKVWDQHLDVEIEWFAGLLQGRRI